MLDKTECLNQLTTKVVCFVICCCIMAAAMENSVDHDQTAPWEQSDIGPYCSHASQN